MSPICARRRPGPLLAVSRRRLKQRPLTDEAAHDLGKGVESAASGAAHINDEGSDALLGKRRERILEEWETIGRRPRAQAQVADTLIHHFGCDPVELDLRTG